MEVQGSHSRATVTSHRRLKTTPCLVSSLDPDGTISGRVPSSKVILDCKIRSYVELKQGVQLSDRVLA